MLMEGNLHNDIKAVSGKSGGSQIYNQKMTQFHIQFLLVPLLAKDTTLIWHCLVLRISKSVCRDEEIILEYHLRLIYFHELHHNSQGL